MANSFDIVIIGASFAGLVCARAAAERGLSVAVVEKKSEPGASVHTTGIFVKEAAEACPLPKRLTRKVRGVRLYAPSLAAILSHRWQKSAYGIETSAPRSGHT